MDSAKSVIGWSVAQRGIFYLVAILTSISGFESYAANPIDLDTVVVAGNSEARILHSTSPLYGLDRSQYDRLGVTDVSDAIHRIPGITLRDYGGAGGLKTVSVRGLGSQHTSVVYDGVVLSDCQSGEVDVSRYTLENISNLSLVIGDNDDIFIPARAAASAATLNISSIGQWSIEKPIELTAGLKVGSFGLISPYFHLGRSLTDRFSYKLTGDFIHSDNNYPFTVKNGASLIKGHRNNNTMDSGHGELNVVWSPSSRTAMDCKIYYYDNDRELPGPVIYYNNENNESLRERNAFGQMRYRHVISSELSMMTLAKFNWASSDYEDIDGKYPGGRLSQIYWQREAYASACLLWLPRESLAFDYSGDYVFNNLTSNLRTDRSPYRHGVLQSVTARYRSKRFTSTARILSSIYHIGAKHIANDKDYCRLSPSASLSVRPFLSELLYMRVSYKNIFRMPTFSESYFYHYGNPDVRPETTNQFNIGATWQARSCRLIPEALLSVDTYVNYVKDKIVAIPYNMFVWTVVNLGKARIFGLDLTGSVTLSPFRRHEIALTGNYSYQRAQYNNGVADGYVNQIAYIPLHSGNITLSYENPYVNMSVHTTMVSGRFATNENYSATYLGGYADTGLTAYRELGFSGHKLEVRADVMNLLNRQYSVVSRYPMPGRSFQFSMKYTL